MFGLYDRYIREINEGKLNINSLDYDTKLRLMKYSFEIAENRKFNESQTEDHYCEERCFSDNCLCPDCENC
jgi:hypothetical protein